MQAFIAYFVVLSMIVSAIVGIPQAIVSRWPRSRNVVAFLIACVSSFSISFAIDMVLLAILGDIPAANIIVPLFTWSGIAIAAGFSAFQCTRSPIAISLPFIINGAIAAPTVLSHFHNLVVAVLLVLVGIAVFTTKRLVAAKEASQERNVPSPS